MEHFFYKGQNDILEKEKDFENQLEVVKKELSKVLDIRNLSFLLGSGCSLGKFGIPTMQKFADIFFDSSEEDLEEMDTRLKKLLLTKEHLETLNSHNVVFKNDPFRNNLETFLGTLYSLRFYLSQINNTEEEEKIEAVILQTKKFILYKCLNEENKGKDQAVLQNYKNFYRKLSLRDSNLPKPNVITTNYDLYSEKALDQLGVSYTNGFSGFVERYFNPSIFNYALAEQMDISSFKWNIIDNFIYFFKIHGSLNWVEKSDSSKLFNVQEIQDVSFKKLKKEKNIMIYPSPIKQNSSLGSPYSDLFREFQKRITQTESVLVTMGYSYSDEHINNLIFQALTIPTFRLVIFTDTKYKDDKGAYQERLNIKKIKDLNDPRIWIIGSNEEPNEGDLPLHWFSTISGNLLPDWSENQIENQNSKIIEMLKTDSLDRNNSEDQNKESDD